MLLNEERILSNYILSIKEQIKELQIKLYHCPSRELFSEMNTLQVVRDDLEEILNNHQKFKTYWVTFNNKGE